MSNVLNHFGSFIHYLGRDEHYIKDEIFFEKKRRKTIILTKKEAERFGLHTITVNDTLKNRKKLGELFEMRR